MHGVRVFDANESLSAYAKSKHIIISLDLCSSFRYDEFCLWLSQLMEMNRPFFFSRRAFAVFVQIKQNRGRFHCVSSLMSVQWVQFSMLEHCQAHAYNTFRRMLSFLHFCRIAFMDGHLFDRRMAYDTIELSRKGRDLRRTKTFNAKRKSETNSSTGNQN